MKGAINPNLTLLYMPLLKTLIKPHFHRVLDTAAFPKKYDSIVVEPVPPSQLMAKTNTDQLIVIDSY